VLSAELTAVSRSGAGFAAHGLSLLTGWLPLTMQAVAALALLAAIGRRPARWFRWRLPALLLTGAAAALLGAWYVRTNGLASDPAPALLWVWVAVSAAAVLLALIGWPGIRWPRRALSIVASVLALLCLGLVLNQWVGYFTTVPEAWGQLTEGPLPDQVDQDQLAALTGQGATMRSGRLVAVDIPATRSHFAYRQEYVYLPPAWFTANRPRLPVLMMIAGEFNTPADWIRVGNAVQTADAFAARHRGTAPVLAFVDSGGSFNNDTECVNGPRGAVADYLTQDVPSYLESEFQVATGPAGWGVVGWSAGGTCAVDLAVTHPELFGTFEDIAGDLGPNAGDRASTIAKLYGGDARAWSAFDPLTVMAAHGRYLNTAGWFDNSSGTGPRWQRPPGRHGGGRPHGPFGARRARAGGPAGYGGRPDGFDPPGTEAVAANQLCTAARAQGITCTLHTQDGRHSWQFATAAFSDAFGWLSGRLGIPSGPNPPAT
jgi:S-formylglutathione hydrolase FrmB